MNMPRNHSRHKDGPSVTNSKKVMVSGWVLRGRCGEELDCANFQLTIIEVVHVGSETGSKSFLSLDDRYDDMGYALFFSFRANILLES